MFNSNPSFFRTYICLWSSTIQKIKTANFESIFHQRSYNAKPGESITIASSDINASTSKSIGAIPTGISTSSRPVPFSSREKLKTTPQVLSNYFNSDPDLQFTIEGIDDISMSKKSQAAKRATKPLAWFLNEQLEQKNSSIEAIMMDQQQQQDQQQREIPSPELRKCSVDSLASSINSTKISDNNNKEETTAGNKKRGKKSGRQRVKKVSVNFTIAGSENKEPITAKAASAAIEDKQHQLLQQQQQPASIAPASVPNAAILMNNTKERKEDYWYYDPLSDGFYYENNGSRGWKKRNPKVHGPPPAAAAKKVPEIEKIIEQQKLQKQLTNQKLLNQIGVAPSVKYYDPATDGYFFEMASVDGWRRRQAPVPSSASSSSNSVTTAPSSVANCERKPINIPSSMASSNMNHQQQQAHHQHQNGYYPPSFGSFSSTTATPTPSPAGSFMPQPAMTNAQLEEMIVRHPSLVASMSKNRFGGLFDEPCIPSNSSTTSSEELTSSPPPMISSVPEHSLLMQHFRRGQHQQQQQSQHLQQSNSASMLINGGSSINNNNNATNSASSCQTNNAFSVGSADEPYEFYWSDNEKASSISSYDDMGDKEQSIPRESVIGGQRRPTTLIVAQDNNKPKPWWDTPLIDHRFDVDRFIADLPSFDDEKILRNLTALPTPLSSDRQYSINNHHPNLITPLKENAWWGGDRGSSSSNTTTFQNGQSSASKNLEKIWRTPIIN